MDFRQRIIALRGTISRRRNYDIRIDDNFIRLVGMRRFPVRFLRWRLKVSVAIGKFEKF